MYMYNNLVPPSSYFLLDTDDTNSDYEPLLKFLYYDNL
jgi:hypothetical protein